MLGGSSIKVFSGSSHPEIAELIAKRIGIPLSKCEVTRNGIGETSVRLGESVREDDVYIIGSGCGQVNTALIELCIMIHACKIASAKRITAVIPLFPYARQDKKDKSRADYGQAGGEYDSEVGLYAEPSIIHYIRTRLDVSKCIIVSPDAGGAKRATAIADRLGVEFALFHKERKKANEVSRMVLVGHVAGKIAILVDDMADTCGTLVRAAQHLVEAGAERTFAFVTHGILSGNALENIEQSALEKVVVTNTIPQKANLARCKKLEVINIANVLGEVIRRSHYGESVSKLFHEVPY
ncbi:Phosphoribosyl pyrophosphokinase [Rhizoctonia solani]|uniref:ribose-phosphate diphosphokinase n=1 Tax=Rhizoctonia solani TaxID=456999 RepID=A0A8H7M983_9AGAM|nr:Phosphoribosyl pyrophosphokinase [Rhizoctonia solani]